MASGDIALRVLITGSTETFLMGVNALGRALGGIFSGLGNSLGMMSYGFRTMGVAGVDSMELIQTGASSAAIGFVQLTAVLAAAAAVAAVALGSVAVKAAGDFQQAVLSLVAHAGLARSQIDTVSQSVLQMATVVGRSPTELADALYPILSAFSGITDQSAKTQLALTTLKLSFEAVAGTTVDGTAVAQAAVGTFNALGLATNNAATNAARMTRLMDQMDLTVQLGNMQWDAYKNVISKLAVSIQGTGISFNEASASLAEMTNEGFNAQKAQTYLANTFNTLAIKTDALAAHAKKLHISFNETAYASMDWAHKLEYLKEITGGNHQTLLALMGSNSTALKTFNALTTGIDGYRSNLDALNHSQGALANSFNTNSQSFNFAWQKVKAAIDVLLIVIGNALLPALTNIASAVAPIITSFATWISSGHAVSDMLKWVGDNSQIILPILAALVTAAGAFAVQAIPPLIAGFAEWAAGAMAAAIETIAATWPVLAIIAAVAALVAIFVALYKNNAGFRQFIDNVWHGMQQLWQVVVTYVQPVWNQFVAWLKGPFIAGMQQAWNWISTVFVAGWKATVAWFQGSFLPAMQKVGAWFMSTIWPVMVQIWQFLVATFVPVWQQLVSTWNNQLIPAFAAIGQIIQNQVFPVFQQLWQMIQKSLWPVFQQLWQVIQTQLWPVFQQLWHVIQTQLWPQLQQLWPVLKVIGGIIGGIIVVAFIFWVGVIAGVVRAIATLISGIIQFIGGVIQFFAGLWQTISGIVQLIVDLCTGHFSKLGADLQQIWSGIQNMWNGLWAAAAGLVKTFVGTIESYVQGFFTTIVGIFQNLFNKLVGHSIIPDLINGIINWFAGLPGKVVSFVSTMVSNLLGKFGDLLSQGVAKIASLVSGIAGKFGQAASDAVNWGANIVNAILKGLQNAWGAITSWLGNALNNIKNMFPHSPVKEGPLVGLEHWGGNIVSNLIGSMRAGLPQLTAAANDMALAVNAPLGSFAVRGGSFALHGNQTIVVQVQPGTVTMDKRQVGDILFPHMATELRRQGTVKNR